MKHHLWLIKTFVQEYSEIVKDDLSNEILKYDAFASWLCVREEVDLLEEFVKVEFGYDQPLRQQNDSFSTWGPSSLNWATSMDFCPLCYKVGYNQHFKESILVFKQDALTFRSWSQVLHRVLFLVYALIRQIYRIWLIYQSIQDDVTSSVLLLPYESFLIWSHLLKFWSLNLLDCRAITMTCSSINVFIVSLPSNSQDHFHTSSNDPSVNSKHFTYSAL